LLRVQSVALQGFSTDLREPAAREQRLCIANANLLNLSLTSTALPQVYHPPDMARSHSPDRCLQTPSAQMPLTSLEHLNCHCPDLPLGAVAATLPEKMQKLTAFIVIMIFVSAALARTKRASWFCWLTRYAFFIQLFSRSDCTRLVFGPLP